MIKKVFFACESVNMQSNKFDNNMLDHEPKKNKFLYVVKKKIRLGCRMIFKSILTPSIDSFTLKTNSIFKE